MACNENVIKNMANEITRNCQAYLVTVDAEFVTYLIDLLLLNPKYGKLFAKTIIRNNLAYFVEECVHIMIHGGTALDTLKMQFIVQKNYLNLKIFLDRYENNISTCVRPLLNDILSADPEINNENEFQKLFRKISIYITLATGLGSPEYITNIREGLAALGSVFQIKDLHALVALSRIEKNEQLENLLAIVAGVRLFNRNCKKGGEVIPDLTSLLPDAGKSCTALLSKTLLHVMQKINTLTTAIYDSIVIQEETGNVIIDYVKNPGITVDDYKGITDVLCYYRQYEAIIRKLLADVQSMTKKGSKYLERVKAVFEELYSAVRFKEAVLAQTVFPLFTKLWVVWKAMQEVMYLLNSVTRLMGILNGIQEHIKINYKVVMELLKEKPVVTDQVRTADKLTLNERLSLANVINYVSPTSSGDSTQKPEEAFENISCEFQGFCALCLTAGVLIPGNLKLGVIKVKNLFYSFCSVKMALQFSKKPERYINEVLNFARNNPHFINLLNVTKRVDDVKDIDELVVKRTLKKIAINKNVQTDLHLHDKLIDKNYSWNLWDHKAKACQWATLVNCKTHSTQTAYTALRSEVHCQTNELHDKCFQTNKDSSTMTNKENRFIWGLRGQRGFGQHSVDLTLPHSPRKPEVPSVSTCEWPCFGTKRVSSYDSELLSDEERQDFYVSHRSIDYDHIREISH